MLTLAERTASIKELYELNSGLHHQATAIKIQIKFTEDSEDMLKMKNHHTIVHRVFFNHVAEKKTSPKTICQVLD